MNKKFYKILIAFLTLLIVSVTVFSGLSVSADENSLNKQNWDNKMMLYAKEDHLVNGYGEYVRLAGVNVPTLDSVVTGDHFWDNFYLAINDWQCNLLRVNLNPCWMPGQPKGSEAKWKTHLEILDKAVNEAVNNDVYIILDDHPGDNGFMQWMPMEQDMEFWDRISKRYGNCPNVIFGLFNEPNSLEDWKKWKHGSGDEKWENPHDKGTYDKIYGMQDLVDVIRSNNAKNLISVTGLESGSLWDGFLKNGLINDRGGNGIMYEAHRYSYADDFDVRYKEVIGKVPLYVGEFNAMEGPYKYLDAVEPWDLLDEESIAFMDRIMDFLDKWDLNFSAWSLHHNYPPMLLEDENPTFNPTASGQIIKDYIAHTRLYKNIVFYKDKNSENPVGALNFGSYNSSALKRHGIDLSSINAIEMKEDNHRYLVTLYSNGDLTGKKLILCGSVNDLKKSGLDFTPKSVKIQRYNPKNVISGAEITADASGNNKKYLIDGTTKMWESSKEGSTTIVFDLKKTYYLDEIKILHAAEAENVYGYHNTSDFRVSVSYDNKIYSSVYAVEENRDSITDIRFLPQAARYVKVVIDKPNRMDTWDCKIVEVEAYGMEFTGDNPKQLYPIIRYVPEDIVTDSNDVGSDFDDDSYDIEFEETYEEETPESDEETTSETSNKKVIRKKKIMIKRMKLLPLWAWIVIGVCVVAVSVTVVLLILRSKKKKALKLKQ